MTATDTRDALVEFDAVSKNYGRIEALRDVSLTVRDGEILGLVGDNGAGKSTLLNIISGVHRPTDGTVKYRGERVSFNNPNDARNRGIETVYQDLALMDDLSIAKNIFMNRFPTRLSVGPLRLIDWNAVKREATEIMEYLNQDMDVTTEVEFLSGGQRQLVAVARALLFEPELLVLDEPTSALSVAGTELVHDTIRQLQTEGYTQLIVSHDVARLLDLADRVAVMYQGKVVETADSDETSQERVTKLMTNGTT